MTDRPVTVVKLGGSLLEWPKWPGRLQRFLGSLADCRVALVVGGGRVVDVVRDLDQFHVLGDDRAHALAMHALGTTARLAGMLLPASAVVGCFDDLPDVWHSGVLPILDPDPILAAIEARSGPVLHTWALTSDSIAARIAVHLDAAELVLLKSVPPPPEWVADAPDWPAAARLGLVDPEFPRLAAAIPRIRLVSLRVS